MGFFSFNEKYYRQKIAEFESNELTSEKIYLAKQILKVLDDLSDEGYSKLNNYLEQEFSCLSRLRDVIKKSGEDPFVCSSEILPDTVYGEKEVEIASCVNELKEQSENFSEYSDNAFIKEIRNYCDWIGYDNNTAYIFLLRDALLPYIFYCNKERKNLYPWLISRRFLNTISSTEDIDDGIRLPIYEALESGYNDFKDFRLYFKEQLEKVLEYHTELKAILCRLLSSVKEDRIVVVESGYNGTIPMMLSALDDRVTFRMYTTAPFLYDTYQSLIYCKRYEDIRKFETLYSQDRLLQFSSFHNNQFYVKVAESKNVLDKSLREIKSMSE